MRNIRKLLIGLGLVILSSNAAAISINGMVVNEYMDMDLSMQDIEGLLSDYHAETRKDSGNLRKANRRFRQLSRFHSKTNSTEMTERRAARMERRKLRKEHRLASVMDQMNLDLTAFMITDDNPEDQENNSPEILIMDYGAIEGSDQPNSHYENDTAQVPEPSTMALFGIGLASLAAARRRKQRQYIRADSN